MLLNKEQVIEALNDGALDVVQGNSYKVKVYDHNGFAIEQVEEHGGFEGAGEEYWIVFSVKRGDHVDYWMLPGFYASHYGSEVEVDNIFPVEAKEVKVVKWEAIK